MPGRPLLFDLRCRNDSICRSCRLAIRQRPARLQQPAASYSSQTTKTSAPKKQPAPSEGVRAPSLQEVKEYLNRFRQPRAPAKEAKPDENFSVRFFEQNSAGGRTEVANGDSLGGDSVEKLDASDLRAALEGIRSQAGGEEKDAFDEMVGQLGGDWSNMKTPADLERLISRIEDYNTAVDKEIDRTGAGLPQDLIEELDNEMPGLPGLGNLGKRVELPQVPEEKPWTMNQRKKVSRLNVVLARTAREMRNGAPSKKTVVAVYKAYHAARLSLAHGWSNVPQDVWDLLWNVFSADESVNPQRLSHLSLLSRDMSDAKVTLNPSQQLLTIEAVFVDGWETKAIENWRRCISSLGEEHAETFQSFWELGVRIFCRVGDLEQAQRATNKLLGRQTDPRILMTMVRTCSELGTEQGQEQAWLAYRQMRGLLGPDMKLEDYDQVISYFLMTQQTENALYAFVDMMSDGKIDLKKQQYMPSVIANKFFFGKWLKRLIGAGDLKGAASVVDFMRRKNVEAAPIHLNGLIGAWQRSGGAKDLENADEMAWGMIESRIEFVEARNPDRKRRGQPKPAPASGLAALPRATLETFSLLAENYRLRGLHDRLEALWQAFRAAKISPDAFIVNQLLESYIQAGQPKDAVAMYHTLVTEQGVAPDPYTFSALWKTLAVSRLVTLPGDMVAAETAETRALFAETAKFRDVFAPDGGMDGQLARKILHTFRQLGDRPGLVVVLTALRDVFGFVPPEALVLEMALGTTRLAWDTPAHRRKLAHAKRALDRALLSWAGGDAARLEGARRGEALFEYLQSQYWPAEGGDETRRRVFVEAATQMGVLKLLKKAAGKR